MMIKGFLTCQALFSDSSWPCCNQKSYPFSPQQTPWGATVVSQSNVSKPYYLSYLPPHFFWEGALLGLVSVRVWWFLAPGMVPQSAPCDFLKVPSLNSSRSPTWVQKMTPHVWRQASCSYECKALRAVRWASTPDMPSHFGNRV